MSSSGMSSSGLGEMEQIVCRLERGTIISRYYNSRRRPEKKTLALRRETRQVIWTSANANSRNNNYDGSIELREVKEIRPGKSSREFEKWAEESKRVDGSKCFVVFYGKSFNLKSLSILALSEEECDIWMKGLKYMVQDTIHSPYPLQVERWLRKEFYSIQNSRET